MASDALKKLKEKHDAIDDSGLRIYPYFTKEEAEDNKNNWRPPPDYKDMTEKDVLRLEEEALGEIKPSTTKYFVCNYCKNWQMVKPGDLKDTAEKIGKEKKTVHMEL